MYFCGLNDHLLLVWIDILVFGHSQCLSYMIIALKRHHYQGKAYKVGDGLQVQKSSPLFSRQQHGCKKAGMALEELRDLHLFLKANRRRLLSSRQLGGGYLRLPSQ